MKPIFLSLLIVAACGSNTGDDSSLTDASPDSTATDSSTKDATSNDAVADVTNDTSPTDSGKGDGGLGSGSPCDPQNNQCASNLLCCSEPTHNFDGGPLSAFLCETPENGQCPKLP